MTPLFQTLKSQENSNDDHKVKSKKKKEMFRTFDISKLQKFIRSIKVIKKFTSESMMSPKRSSVNFSNQISKANAGVLEKNLIQVDINETQESEFVNWYDDDGKTPLHYA